ETGNHHVEHEKVEAFVLRALERLFPIPEPLARVPFEAEMQTHQLADIRLVFDDEDPRRDGVFDVRTVGLHSYMLKIRMTDANRLGVRNECVCPQLSTNVRPAGARPTAPSPR